MSKQFSALSINYQGLPRELNSDIAISDAFEITNQVEIRNEDERLIYSKALWDTGATNSSITRSLAQKAGLVQKGIAKTYHAGGTSLVPVYIIHLYLPNKIVINHLRVSEIADTIGNFDVLIGMDVITRGDFSLTNHNGNGCFSFRIPSIKKVDFVEEYNGSIIKPSMGPISRNSPCHCGSGKKYKHCHGKD